MAELSILDPRVLPGVVTDFEASENFVGRNLMTIDNDEEAKWEYDIVRPHRVAQLLHNAHNAEAQILDQTPLGHISGAYAYLRDKKTFSPSTLRLLRALGEGRTSSGRNAEARVLAELEDMRMQYFRAEEIAIWEMLQGTWTYLLVNNVTITATYGMAASHIVTVANNWGGGSDTPEADIDSIKQVVSRDCGFPITTAYMNNSTMNTFQLLTEVAAQLSDRQKDQFTREGVVPRYRGIDWVEYDGTYVDSTGTAVPYIPDDLIVFLATGGSRHLFLKYGPSVDIDAPPGWTGPFTKSWTEPDPSGRQVLMEQQYMPIMTNPLKVATLDITA